MLGDVGVLLILGFYFVQFQLPSVNCGLEAGDAPFFFFF